VNSREDVRTRSAAGGKARELEKGEEGEGEEREVVAKEEDWEGGNGEEWIGK